MQYQITIQNQTHVVSETVALKASKGRPIPPEGLTIEGQTQNVGNPDHVPQTVVTFIKPI